MNANLEDFKKLDIRVGKIVAIEDFPEARKPLYKITVYRIVNRKPIRDRNRYDDVGTGGMESKVKTAGQVARSGINTFITNGKTPNVLLRIARGENLGTRFGRGWMLY